MSRKRHTHVQMELPDEAKPSPGYIARMVFNIILAFLTMGVCLSVGYGLANLIFQKTGRPQNLAAYLIAVFLGFLVFAGIATLFGQIMRRSQRDNALDRHRHPLYYSTIEALDRIAHGDFDISVPIPEHDPMTELAESVNKMAQQLSCMEAQRQDFISNVSHEIQSPLTSISGFAALLRTDSLTKEQRAHYLDIIETESKRLSKLSDNLLKLSSLEAETTPLYKSEFRLDKQIGNAVLMLEPQWSEKQIDIEADLAKVGIQADEALLSQVWINLLHNAVKFTPTGGKISITLWEAEHLAHCKIADSGIGIPTEDQMHIFERFYKVDKARDRSLGGNGLGLPIVKKIVELHGGSITLKSETGKGTEFTVALPA